MNNFLSWWALPALCVLLALLQVHRHIERGEPSELKATDWLVYLFGSALWPIGMIAIVCTLTGPFCRFLTKERSWGGK